MSTASGTDTSGSEKVEEVARRHPWMVTVARIGWVAKGVVYALLGVIAVPIALNGLEGDDSGESGSEGDGEVSQTGAIAEIAETSIGGPLLWLVAAGLALYVIWRLVSIALPAENGAKAWLTRGAYLVSAAVYAALAWSAVSFARHGGGAGGNGESENARIERYTREVMERTGGRSLIGLVGLGIIGIGVFFVARGIRADFRDELEGGSVGPLSRRAIVNLGRVGWIGRGLMMGLIGWFLALAAVRFDPDEAQGLDGALRDATATTIGAALVGVVALTLIVFGLFCIVSAPRQKLSGVD